ncbi:hypothetical protein GP486_007320 [Trichoglossum hirsutum]|uniref:Uncharacterized protein n=1 Tax=Trichoglossum hirsutum TaxID=265104 RepID=A0A9P8IG10_9PEZI|nr:hypothetical protein GP486_007320 [Trichoglossum hirsutum]
MTERFVERLVQAFFNALPHVPDERRASMPRLLLLPEAERDENCLSSEELSRMLLADDGEDIEEIGEFGFG